MKIGMHNEHCVHAFHHFSRAFVHVLGKNEKTRTIYFGNEL